MTQVESPFVARHIGPSDDDVEKMLGFLKLKNLGDLTSACAPKSILSDEVIDIGEGLEEVSFLKRAKEVAHKNKILKSCIGRGYYGTHTPGVIQRNILENPLWYTAYTPYQAEISQGRMEALLNFQTMVTDLTGMEISNASLLDEGTAIAEAAALAFHFQKKNPRNKLFVDQNIYPQSLEVLKTRMAPIDVDIEMGDFESLKDNDKYFATIVQYPNSKGSVQDLTSLCKRNSEVNTLSIVSTDLLALCLIKSPGAMGADIVVGSSQRFGVPMGFGGPHAAFLATQDKFKRLIPGRIIGVSKDVNDQPALRLALQTREQHIRREKATSNICTAQVLLAVIASMYAVYHGPKGLQRIARRTHGLTSALAKALKNQGHCLCSDSYFDTICVEVSSEDTEKYLSNARKLGINLGSDDKGNILISLDETTTKKDVENILKAFDHSDSILEDFLSEDLNFKASLLRDEKILEHKVFNSYHSETEMLRYITKLQSKDLSLAHAMIPLGSCTMKLNATTEMQPITWPEFAHIHPFAPLDQAQGYMEMVHQLENWLAQITGFDAVSLQPNAGSQGEYAGLLVIRKYLQEKGDTNRNVCLIPSSAHGTNPASAVMAGMKVQVVKCDSDGNIDLNDLKEKSEKFKDSLAALMITYPSTHGVFESTLTEICDVIHNFGGLVYMDGANLNALLGISLPGKIGPDVCHLNLHKTFCIPHGGGGPGIGPIAVKNHLKDFLPGNEERPESGGTKSIGAISAAPWGSASILPISWGYIALMGYQGLKKATQVAILNANYIAKKLEPHFDILYRGQGDWIAHECIIDVRPLKDSTGVSVDDIAKRLIDYGFHAPTMSWPVAGTLMIEPTESESLEEIDRFCEALINISKEAKEIEEGKYTKEDNVLVNSPHSIDRITSDNWSHSYSREKAAYPLGWVKDHKFWAPVARVDNAFGDRNLVCNCPGLEDYED